MNAFDFFFENSGHLEKPFLIGTESISYKDLFNSSLQLAFRLRGEIGEKKNVLLISSNNLFFIITYLAILKSGNICIPLDPGIEKDNFRFILDITKPELIFLTHTTQQKLDVGSLNCIFPENLQSGDLVSFNLKGIEDTKENDCAEIIFTSGSTGKPKGVIISHKNIIANTKSILSYLNLNMDDRMLVVLPFYYCYGLSVLHTHIRAGGSIVLNNSFIFLGKIITDLLDYECTGFAGVPSHFQMLLRTSDSFKKTAFPALRYVTQAGGGLATRIIDEFRESFPNLKFYVMYGQTEATARLSYLPPEVYEKKKGSIGKGIPGVELKVVNENGEKVKTGEIGEVIAQGDNIMTGYLGDEEGTSDTIRNGWLYTGDLGTIDIEDYIYLIARKKEIIKIGGKRISPKEIENVIFLISEVVDCTVESFADELLGDSIKATVVIDNLKDSNLTPEKIKQHCANKLALYKVPKIIEITTRMQINQAGKKVNQKL